MVHRCLSKASDNDNDCDGPMDRSWPRRGPRSPSNSHTSQMTLIPSYHTITATIHLLSGPAFGSS